MAEFASKGLGGTALGFGIAGTAMSALNGGLQNLLGGVLGGNNQNAVNALAELGLAASLLGGNAKCCGGCNETIGATRYDLGVMNQLAEKDAIIARLQGSQEIDKKILELYQYVNSRDKATGETIAQIAAAQAVQNQKINDNMKFIEADLNNKIAAEKNARCCADNSIVTYANATFYAKLVADVTAGTETTAQATYNPIPNCGCGCGC